MKRDIKKFYLRLLIFAAPFVLLSAAVMLILKVFPMYAFDSEYPVFWQQKEYISNSTEYNDVIIIGDSKAKVAFYPPLLSEKTYNISMGGTSSIENYYYLKEYLENHEKPKYVIVSISSVHIYHDSNFWGRCVYFHTINHDDMMELLSTSENYKDSSEVLTNSGWFEYFQYQTYFITKYWKAFTGALSGGRYEKNMEKYEEVKKNRGQTQYGTLDYCDGLSIETGIDEFKSLDILDSYYRKIFDLCIQNGIKVIVESTPLNEASYKALTDKFKKSYSDYMKKIKADYPDVVFGPDFVCYGNEYFGDANHLNWNGTVKFTKAFREEYKYIFE